MSVALALRGHPLSRPRILLSLCVVLFAVHLPFLHLLLRGPAAVNAAAPFRDDFQRASLGRSYWSNGGDWRIAAGQVYSPGVGNNPLWLLLRLPPEVRIEFDARSDGADGDLKFEAFGDGRNHSTGYVFIFGGWHNRETRIAKLDEHALTQEELRVSLASAARPVPRTLHGFDRMVEAMREPMAAWSARRELARLEEGTYYDADTPLVVKRTDLRVERGRTYHMVVTRKGGLVRWEIDGNLALELADPVPLSGSSHDRFGFSSWQNDTYFDNLNIAAL
ncbi:MAG: hypothetical protein ACJ781_12360 [Myxococcales bacterium]